MVTLKITKAQKAAIWYDVEAMWEDAHAEGTKTSCTILTLWPKIEAAAKTGKLLELDAQDARWLSTTVLENIIDIGSEHAASGDRQAAGQVRCAKNLMAAIKKQLKSEKPNQTPIELKHHGSDEPICPSCGHNNAMLSENPAKATYKCRDCGFTCVSVCFVNLDSEVNRA